MGEKLSLGVGTLYFNGCEVKGIPDFECSEELFEESIKNSSTSLLDYEELAFTTRLDFWSFVKLCGVWDWVMRYCPNKRVVHLAKYGRTTRVRHKNFRRACRLLEKEILS